MHILLAYPSTQSHIAERLQSELAKLPRLTVQTKSSPAEADLVMVIWDGSPDTQTTIQVAQAEFKQILPILVDEAELPENLVGAYFIDLRQNPEAGLRKLVAEMRNRLGIPDVVTAPLSRDPMADKLDYLEVTEPVRLPELPTVEAPRIPWAWLGGLIGIGLAILLVIVVLLSY